jgi:hypothetical protein
VDKFEELPCLVRMLQSQRHLELKVMSLFAAWSFRDCEISCILEIGDD